MSPLTASTALIVLALSLAASASAHPGEWNLGAGSSEPGCEAQGIEVPEACAEQVRAARAATAKYKDLRVAIADGFVPATDCYQDGSAGAQGEHWVRVDRAADQELDVREPELLLYLPAAGGHRLIAAEWVVPLLEDGRPHYGSAPPDASRSTRAPTMFGGREFDGPMQGHPPTQSLSSEPQATPYPWHYDLHVWLWEDNPAGLFAQYNARLSCPGERADGSRRTSTSFEGASCKDPAVFGSVPVAQLRPFVPERFTPRPGALDDPNLLIELGTSCAELAVDGTPVPPGRGAASVGARIESPDGSPGLHYYAPWIVTDIPELQARLAGAGVFGDLVLELKKEMAALGPLTSASVAVPWSHSPHHFELDAGAPYPVSASRTVTVWHLGSKGLVRIAYELENLSLTLGRGSIDTEPGSPLAAMLGRGDRQDVAGGVFSYRTFKGALSVASLQSALHRSRRPRIRLRVRPRVVTAGRRTTFVLRTTIGSGRRERPLARARVRLGRRTARTDRRGRAKIVTRFRVPGSHRVRATKPRYARGTAMIRVRSPKSARKPRGERAGASSSV